MPEQTALIFDEVRVDYQQLAEAIRRLANGLKVLGVEKGDRIALLMPNVPHFIISYYAAMALGAIAVPIPIPTRTEDLQHFLLDSGARVLIAWSGFRAHIATALQQTLPCEHVLVLGKRCPKFARPLTTLMAESEADLQATDVADSDPAVINYTAGIAQESFGAVLSHGALFSNMQISRDLFRISDRDRIAAVVPLYHPMSQTLSMNMALLTGATLVLMPRFQADRVLQTLHNEQVTFLPAVPSLFSALINVADEEIQLPRLKYCLCYGGRVEEEQIARFESRFNTRVFVGYGLTETGPLVSCHRLHSERLPHSVGQPIVGVEAQIRDEDGARLLPNNTGEIWVRSPSLMTSYFNRPTETTLRLKEGWLFTGDIGYFDLDHYLYVSERKEDLIFKSGFPIFPHEVEDVLRAHAAVEEVAVVGVEQSSHAVEVKAFVVLRAGTLAGEQELITFCQQALPLYKCPRLIEFRSALPKSATGRVLKRLLRSCQ